MSTTHAPHTPMEKRKEMSPTQREVANFEKKMEEKLEQIFLEETAILLTFSPVEAGRMILHWIDERSALTKIPVWTSRYADYLQTTHADWIEKRGGPHRLDHSAAFLRWTP